MVLLKRKNGKSEDLEEKVVVTDRITYDFFDKSTKEERKYLKEIGEELYNSIVFAKRRELRNSPPGYYTETKKILIGYDTIKDREKKVRNVYLREDYTCDRIEKIKFNKNVSANIKKFSMEGDHNDFYHAEIIFLYKNCNIRLNLKKDINT